MNTLKVREQAEARGAPLASLQSCYSAVLLCSSVLLFFCSSVLLCSAFLHFCSSLAIRRLLLVPTIQFLQISILSKRLNLPHTNSCKYPSILSSRSSNKSIQRKLLDICIILRKISQLSEKACIFAGFQRIRGLEGSGDQTIVDQKIRKIAPSITLSILQHLNLGIINSEHRFVARFIDLDADIESARQLKRG